MKKLMLTSKVTTLALVWALAPAAHADTISCPLVDGREYSALLKEVNELTSKLKPIKDCDSEKQLSSLDPTAKSITTAAKELMASWNDPAILQDPDKMKLFQQHVENLGAGIENIGSTLANSGIFTGENNCTGGALTASSVISSIGNISTTLAPYAMVAASMNPAWAAGLKVVLGGVGVGGVSQLFNNIKDQQNFDMSFPENREFVLEQTCSYYRIAQKVRLVKLAQSGQLGKVTNELSSYRSQVDERLRTLNVNPTRQLVQMRDSANAKFSKISERQANLQRRLQAISRSLPSSSESICARKDMILKSNVGTESSLNLRALFDSDEKLQNDPDSSFLLQSEENLRSTLESLGSDLKARDAVFCGRQVSDYLDMVSKINLKTAEVVRESTITLETTLRKDKNYIAYLEARNQGLNEIKNLEKLSHILELLSRNNAVIDLSEISAQMEVLRRALLDPGGFKFSWSILKGNFSRPSIISEWLKYVDNTFQVSLNQFQNSVKQLRREALNITETKGRANYPIDYQRLTPYDLRTLKKIERDNSIAYTLSNISPSSHPKGSRQQQFACKILEDSWLQWAATLDHLGAQHFFCKTIRPLVRPADGSEIQEHCFNSMTLAGDIVKRSALAQREAQLVESKARASAQLVNQKLKEISCELPDPKSISL